MTSFRINDDEREILRRSDLSHAAKVLYVVGVRPRMDFGTGIVGKVRRVSYQTFHEDLEYLPPHGSKREARGYSVAAIRALLEELVRAGLIRRLPNDKGLIFLECLCADRRDASKNVNDRGTTHKNDRVNDTLKPSDTNGCGVVNDTMNDSMNRVVNNTPQVSGKPVYTSKAAAILTSPVDNFAALLFEDVVDWLKTAEKRRGKIMAIAASDQHIKSWVCRGVDAETLAEAHALAVAARERDHCEQPVYTGFVNRFIDEALAKRKAWHQSASGIERKAVLLGLVRLPDEAFPSFKARVFAAAGITDDEVRRWAE